MPQAITFNQDLNLAPVPLKSSKSSKSSKSKRTSTAPSKKKVATVPAPTAKVGTVRHKFTGNTIKVIGKVAPVREGTQRAKIFALFQDGMAVTEFLSQARKLRGGSPDIQIALEKEFIELV